MNTKKDQPSDITKKSNRRFSYDNFKELVLVFLPCHQELHNHEYEIKFENLPKEGAYKATWMHHEIINNSDGWTYCIDGCCATEPYIANAYLLCLGKSRELEIKKERKTKQIALLDTLVLDFIKEVFNYPSPSIESELVIEPNNHQVYIADFQDAVFRFENDTWMFTNSGLSSPCGKGDSISKAYKDFIDIKHTKFAEKKETTPTTQLVKPNFAELADEMEYIKEQFEFWNKHNETNLTEVYAQLALDLTCKMFSL